MPRVQGEAVGQNEDRCSRLRGLIDRYPEDAGILKELIQNADDGKAREVRIILDDVPREQVVPKSDPLSIAAGAAIIAWNDKPFEERDFENLENLANSGKIEDAFKTGRFGLGFNAVYNVTDFPLLLTRDRFWCLDPCQTLVEGEKGGMRWLLQDLIENGDADILELFAPAGYQPGSFSFPSTAIRLPLRNSHHIGINQDPRRPGEALISSKPFTSHDFIKVIDGLGAIAHELLLFQKNVESVICSRLDEKGKEHPLLEVRVVNSEEVRNGRETINRILREGLAASLAACKGREDAPPESCYPVQIEVKRHNGRSETSSWLVVSGLYPGPGDTLIEASHTLKSDGERGLPHASAAVCLAKNGESIPTVQGRLFCYLPIAGSEYAGNFPVHIHGAFSVDDSRTTLTGHREDEKGKAAARAKWNELLIEHGASRAYGRAVEETRRRLEAVVDAARLAERIYCLFPSLDVARAAHSDLLAKSTLRILSELKVFHIADGAWVASANVLVPPESGALSACLEQEQFPILVPDLPSKLLADFQVAEVTFPALDAEQVVDHFTLEEAGEWEIEEAPFPGIRRREAVIAVARFLVGAQLSDWSLLPLAICADGWLRTFPTADERPLFIGTKRQQRIYDWFPHWFLDFNYSGSCQLATISGIGFTVMSTTQVLEHLDEMLNHPETGESCWDPEGEDSPNIPWLIALHEEILDDPEVGESESFDTLLKQSRIVPADDNDLHCPGSAESPLLVQNTETSLTPLLTALDVHHYVLNPQDPLTQSKILTRFKSRTELLWSLTPGDLIDSLGVKIEKLLASKDEWGSEKTVARLIKFLMGIGEDDLTDARIKTLKQLPIWKDATGSYGPVGEHDCLQADFVPPVVPLDIRIFTDGDQIGLLSLLGVEQMQRRTLLVHHLLTQFAGLDDDNFLVVTRWVRDEWNFLCREFPDGEEELRGVLWDRPLVLDSSGGKVPAHDLYLPEAADLAREILGTDTARVPSADRYTSEQSLWADFFRKLGIHSTPSPQHLADFLESIAEECKDRAPIAEEEGSLIRILRHVVGEFDALADVVIKSRHLGEVGFGDFLKTTKWIPAHRATDGRERFGAWRDPEARLFEPRELIHFNLGARCASTRPLSPRGVDPFSREARERLEADYRPSAAEVCGHLRNVVENLGQEQIDKESCEGLTRILREIYRGLGELEREAERGQSGNSTKSLLDECGSLTDFPCLLDPNSRRFRLPRDVYRTGAGRMAPLKIDMVGGTDEVERGLVLLGRLDQPGPEDLAATLVDLAIRDQTLDDTELRAAGACIERLVSLLRDDPDLDVPPVALPNGLGQMRDPADLLVADDTLLRQALAIPDERLLHPLVSPSAASMFQVARLTSAEAQPSGELVPCDEQRLVERCQAFQNLLRSHEFREGLERLLRHDGRDVFRPSLKWLQSVSVKAYELVTCSYSLRLTNGKSLPLGEAESEVAFAPKGDGGEFLVSLKSSAAGLLENHFLRELLRQLDENAPTRDRESLLAILRCSPSEIHAILDRLHVCGASPTEQTAEDAYEPIRFGGDDPDEDSAQDGYAEDSGDLERSNTKQNQKLDSDEEEQETGDAPQPDEGDEPEDAGKDRPPRQRTGAGSSGGGGHRGGQGGGGNTRHPGSNGTGPSRGRMTAGDEDARMEADRVSRNARQQDGFWISRPKTARQAQDDREQDDSHYDEDAEGRNLDIGKMAVGWVLQYERSQGRKAMSMAHANPGYDVESRKGRVVERYIEVKGIDGEWGKNGVALSPIQFFRAKEPETADDGNSSGMGDRFWLYVVEHARDPRRVRIHMIQNPMARTTEFRFDCGWRDAGTEVDGFVALEPERGMKLWKILDEGGCEEGIITRVDENNYLTVRFGAEAAKTVIYDPTRHLLIR